MIQIHLTLDTAKMLYNSLGLLPSDYCDVVLVISDSDSDIYLFDHIITNILHNYQFCSEYKRVIGQGDHH